ncbi:hypothetical protein Q867_14375 [Listeria monocytogenes]|nr:hypothetical protein [Listeria monocytogenes]
MIFCFIYVVSRLAIVAAMVYFLYLLRGIVTKKEKKPCQTRLFYVKKRLIKLCERTWNSLQQGM